MTTRKQWIPGGDFGAVATLRAMAAVVNADLTNEAVLTTARAIVAPCPDRDLTCQAEAVRAWLAAHWRFVQDPFGVELLHTPQRLLETIAEHGYAMGDCDDAAILAAAIGKAIGLLTCFVAVGFHPPGGPLRHVYAVFWVGDHGWIEADVTRPKGPRPNYQRAISWRV